MTYIPRLEKVIVLKKMVYISFHLILDESFVLPIFQSFSTTKKKCTKQKIMTYLCHLSKTLLSLCLEKGLYSSSQILDIHQGLSRMQLNFFPSFIRSRSMNIKKNCCWKKVCVINDSFPFLLGFV